MAKPVDDIQESLTFGSLYMAQSTDDFYLLIPNSVCLYMAQFTDDFYLTIPYVW